MSDGLEVGLGSFGIDFSRPIFSDRFFFKSMFPGRKTENKNSGTGPGRDPPTQLLETRVDALVCEWYVLAKSFFVDFDIEDRPRYMLRRKRIIFLLGVLR